jgi:hypothetical protein
MGEGGGKGNSNGVKIAVFKILARVRLLLVKYSIKTPSEIVFACVAKSRSPTKFLLEYCYPLLNIVQKIQMSSLITEVTTRHTRSFL